MRLGGVGGDGFVGVVFVGGMFGWCVDFVGGVGGWVGEVDVSWGVVEGRGECEEEGWGVEEGGVVEEVECGIGVEEDDVEEGDVLLGEDVLW